MQKPNVPSFLKQEREQTDNSLTSERGKTDRSLKKRRTLAEVETDAQVKIDRQDADDVRAQNRTDADLQKSTSRQHGMTGAIPTRNSEQKLDDSRTSEQRLLVDESVEIERTLMDAAIKKERAQKEEVINKFLHHERQATDGSLLNERKKTDLEVKHSTLLLNAEQTLHTTTKAELTTRDEFAAIVSHDLKNPIGAIQSCAEMLLEDPTFTKTMDPGATYWIEMIRRNAADSLRLINDILDMERVSQGNLEMRFADTDLSKLIEQSTERFVHVAQAKNIKLISECSKDLSMVHCDQDRITQVLSNLIGNSIKFTPEDGSVTLTIQKNKSEFQISICDTGPGIADDKKLTIFNRFAQLHNKDRQGLGLGLYISKMFVEAHHGKLWVTSSIGHGSTFHFTLPI
jgi:signal transduction histidine kinase